MFQAGEIVFYAPYGVCRVVEITEQTLGGKPESYYVLRPVEDERVVFYVPLGNPVLAGRMRRVLGEQEIRALIRSMPETPLMATEEEEYKHILTSGDPQALICLIKTLHARREERAKTGKQLFSAHEHVFQEAERILYEEFAYSLKLRREEVLPFILGEIEKNGNMEKSGA